MIRLKKPLSHYIEKYEDPLWATKKLLRLLEEQKNRGSDGAGISVVQFDIADKKRSIHQYRSIATDAISQIRNHICSGFLERSKDIERLKATSPFIGEVYLGHVRYSTYSGIGVESCQPFVIRSLNPKEDIAFAGNYNMTNTGDLAKKYNMPDDFISDSQVLTHMIVSNYKEIKEVEDEALFKTLQLSAKDWDGGYVICGAVGNGDLFVLRDPAGIRPGFFFENDEVYAVASERIALMNVFNVPKDKISPLPRAGVTIIKKDGEIKTSFFTDELEIKQCMFERIYFSSTNDPDIYSERKKLGKELAKRVYKLLPGDLEDVIFTYVPSSSLLAFRGLVDEVSVLSRRHFFEKYLEDNNPITLEKASSIHAREEYLLEKNKKQRSFIVNDKERYGVVRSLYQIQTGIVNDRSILVVVDDSIVRGTTMKHSILSKLIELNPKKIILVSSAPPIQYPDCYGIDMSSLKSFVAFDAAISLHEEMGNTDIFQKIKEEIKEDPSINHVKRIYAPFSLEHISKKIAEKFISPYPYWDGTLEVVYQSVQGMHRAIPEMKGDWYFTGEYPTLGGNRVSNKSFINWINGDSSRSY